VSVSRRGFLASIPAIFAALRAVSTGQITPATEMPFIAAPEVAKKVSDDILKRTLTMIFPDGTTWTCDGYVTSATTNASIDGIHSLGFSFQPSGDMTREKGKIVPTPRGTRARRARGMQAFLDDQEMMVQSIEAPRVEAIHYEDHFDPQHHMFGMRRLGEITMEVNVDDDTMNNVLKGWNNV
jgi:hypothetical protein